MRVPFLNLRELHEPLLDEFMSVIRQTVLAGEFILGPSVEEFERNFADYCRMPHAIGVNTGTSALHLSLLALGVGPGDEVITCPSTFVATVAAIVYTGARPVFVDAEANSWTMDSSQIESVVSKNTKAIIPIHLHGRMSDMRQISEIAKRRNLLIIEDSCQAHGAESDGIRPGDLSAAAAFSFYPGKNLGAFGEGGAIVTKDAELAKRLRLLRNWGSAVRYQHVEHAYNYRMDGIQGAILNVKLRHLEQWTLGRQRVADWYYQHLAGMPVRLPKPTGGRHSYHIFSILCDDRDRVQSELRKSGIETSCHYPIPVHLQPAYATLGYESGAFPVAEDLAKRWISLPIDPNMTEEQVIYIAEVLRRVI